MFTDHRPLSQLEKKPKKNLPSPVFLGLLSSVIFYFSSFARHVLTLQRLKHVGFLCTFTSKYTRKYIRLMSFHKTFITKDTFVSINDNIRLVSKPFYIFSFKSQYYLNFYYLLIFLFPYYVVYRNYQIFHYIY